MDIHKPKPVHTWREFVGEIGIIVIGVLIALSAEQAVEAFHHHNQLREAEERMTVELRDDDLPQAFARVSIGRCNVAQLGQLEAAARSGDRGRVTDLAARYVPPFRSWDDAAWQAALSSQALVHADGDRMIAWSTAYAAIPILTHWTSEEQASLPRLRSGMSGTGALSPAQIDRLLGVLADLRSTNLHMDGGAQALLGLGRSLGIEVPAGVRARILDTARRLYGPCVVDPASATRRADTQFDVVR